MPESSIDQAVLDSVPLIDQLKELKREQHMREHVYPGLIGRGTLKPADAAKQKLRLEAAIATIDRLWRKEQADARPPELPL